MSCLPLRDCSCIWLDAIVQIVIGNSKTQSVLDIFLLAEIGLERRSKGADHVCCIIGEEPEMHVWETEA